jgi:membrane protein YdbS with pleckstrin-like domain
MDVRVGEDFKPSSQFKTLYYIYAALGALGFIVPWLIPMAVFGPPFLGIILLAPALVVLILVVAWIPLYYESITYRLTDSEIVWNRGVWFRMTGIVPYSRITNIDITQGPISRSLGIAALRIQTAGYSSQTAPFQEIKLEGVTNFDQLRELIMSRVRGRKPVATETYDEGDVETKILEELARIRQLLERQQK